MSLLARMPGHAQRLCVACVCETLIFQACSASLFVPNNLTSDEFALAAKRLAAKARLNIH